MFTPNSLTSDEAKVLQEVLSPLQDWDLYLSGSLEPGACSKKLLQMHQSLSWGRMIRGANRSGKSTFAVRELVWALMGYHPYRTNLPALPVTAKVICPTLPISMDEKHPQRDLVKNLTPEFLLRDGSWTEAWSAQVYTLHFQNGSHIEFVSGDQDPHTQAGTSGIGVLWVDEECPRGHFVESLRGMVDVPSSYWFMTYWPEQKWSWVREYEERALKGDIQGVEVGPTVTIHDNAHNLTQTNIDQFQASILPSEVGSRMGGEYTEGEDLVFGGLDIPIVKVV